MNYIVKQGDTLALIAQNQLGDKNRWPEIALLNKVAKPYIIKIGQTLVLPGSVTTTVREFTEPTIVRGGTKQTSVADVFYNPYVLGIGAIILSVALVKEFKR